MGHRRLSYPRHRPGAALNEPPQDVAARHLLRRWVYPGLRHARLADKRQFAGVGRLFVRDQNRASPGRWLVSHLFWPPGAGRQRLGAAHPLDADRMGTPGNVWSPRTARAGADPGWIVQRYTPPSSRPTVIRIRPVVVAGNYLRRRVDTVHRADLWRYPDCRDQPLRGRIGRSLAARLRAWAGDAVSTDSSPARPSARRLKALAAAHARDRAVQ